jgi:putative ABC transport system permease protein
MTPLRRSSIRYLLRHPWQIGLAVVGVTLGVAIAVGMDLAIGSARTAFRISAETVAGTATHQIVGGPGGVDSDVYRALRVELGIRDAAPVIEDDVRVEHQTGRVFRLLGVDPLAEQSIRPFLADVAEGVSELMLAPGVWLSADAAALLRLGPGDTLAVIAAGRTTPLRVAGLLQPADRFTARALETLLVTDISTAQAVLQAPALTRIDMRVQEGEAGAGTLAAVAAVLPDDARIVAAGARSAALLEMTRAFRINLTALSLLAVVFGVFFIYNAVTFSVVQRRTLFGTMRALGVTRGRLISAILLEAALLGAIGGMAGVLLGIALGQGLVGFVTTTINDLYFAVTVRQIGVSAGAVMLGMTLGIGGALLGALAPALEAANVQPRAALLRSVLETRARRAVPRLALGGAALGAIGAALLAPRAHLAIGFAGLFAIIVGCALLTPWATALLMRGVRPVAATAAGALGRLATGGVASALSRTAPALAALMVAIATTVALGIMIGSFRASVVAWLEATLRADVYVSAPGIVASRPEGALDTALVEAFARTDGVAAVATYRRVELLTADGPLRIGVLDPAGARTSATYQFASGDPTAAWQAFEVGDALVSEPFAYLSRTAVGDSIVIPTDRGERRVRVAGIFYDYGPDRGIVLLHRQTYDALFDDRTVGSLAIYAAAGVPADVLVERLRRVAADADQALNIRANRALREASLEVFDRTFLVTAVLRVLAFVVAFVGVLAALAALQLERAREFGVLRATGVTPAQLRGLVIAQTGLMGLAAGLLALPVGALLAALMVFVINRRSFGWSLAMQVDGTVIWQAIVLALLAALLAGIAPAIRLARVSPALALREE